MRKLRKQVKILSIYTEAKIYETVLYPVENLKPASLS